VVRVCVHCPLPMIEQCMIQAALQARVTRRNQGLKISEVRGDL